MKVLIVDDMLERQVELAFLLQKQFEQKNIEDWQIFVATSYREAVKKLNENYYDYIFLDHDLGGLFVMESSEENTGYSIAVYMSDNYLRQGEVIVHSINPVDAQNIKKVILDAKIIPYPFLVKTLRSTVAQ